MEGMTMDCYGMIVCSVPPSAEVICHGDENFVREQLGTWAAAHPLPEFSEALVLRVVGTATA